MVGTDAGNVLVYKLQCCLGLFIRLANGRLVGAHFTPTTTTAEMNLIMGQIRLTAAGNPIVWMTMAAKYNFWADSASGLTTPQKLASYFRYYLQYTGAMNCADMSFAPASYDILCSTGVASTLGWRATPGGPSTVHPSPHVHGLCGAGPRTLRLANTPTSAPLHALPNNLGGFAPLGGLQQIV